MAVTKPTAAPAKREYRKSIEITTPAGVAAYTYVTKPDTGGQFSDDKFKITLKLAADTDFAAIDASADAEAIAEWGPKVKNVGRPYREVEEGDEAGTFTVRAKSKFRPAVYSANRTLLWNAAMGEELPKEARVHPGDVVKLRIALVPNTAGGNKQVSPRLLAVQIIEKRGGGNDADYSGAFDDEGAGQGPSGETTPAVSDKDVDF